MENQAEQHSLLYLTPFDGESISHYLGRWFRKETVNISNSFSLAKTLRLGKTLYRWERFYFNPPPDQEELEKMSDLMGVEIERLRAMFPPEAEPIKPTPIRMCAACYAEAPYHRMAWQFKSMTGCEKHGLRLLSSCPSKGCNQPFPIPLLWIRGSCEHCGMKFSSMAKQQKPC